MNTVLKGYNGIIHRYRDALPVNHLQNIVTLQEGNTPLIKVDRLAQWIGLQDVDVYVKYEGLNPTGSFKDRGMTYAITKAVEEKSENVICASTGNTSAAAAAYGAKAGLNTFILIPDGYVALGKLSQALLYGAKVIAIQGNFDQALLLVREIGEAYPVTIVNSVNPYRIEGQKTSAFEICDELGVAPDYLFIPVGNAGNITAYWKGFQEYHIAGKTETTPKMCGFEADGAAPIVKGKPVDHPETVATAIRIGNPASWNGALASVRESNGFIDSVSDDQIMRSYQSIARLEGIFCEPASAASIAGLYQYAQTGTIKPNSKIVCVLTGNGLKDPDNAIKYSHSDVIKCTPVVEDVLKAMKF